MLDLFIGWENDCFPWDCFPFELSFLPHPIIEQAIASVIATKANPFAGVFFIKSNPFW